MKFSFFLMLAFIALNVKCKLDRKNLMLTTYHKIEQSKQNKAFIIEYKPEQPYLEIEGKKLYIKNAWLEHPHRELNSGDTVVNTIYCFVMSLSPTNEHKPELLSYLSVIGSGGERVWRFAHIKNMNDTIELKYRSTLNSPNRNKRFKFFPELPVNYQ